MPRISLSRVLLAMSLLAGMVCWDALDAHGAEPVVVETADGRLLFGHFDARSSRRELVVRSGDDGMYLLRSVAWPRVVQVRIAGRALSASDLLSKFDAEGWPRAQASARVSEPPSPPPPARHPAPTELPAPRPATVAPAVEASWLPARALYIDAKLGKWTSYVDSDGIVVRVFPMDELGQTVPVAGTLEIELIGMQKASLTRGEPFRRLGRWLQLVRHADFEPGAAVYRFRFQAMHPDFDLQLGSIGVVHARLVVPGQGVFDHTADMVWIRPYSYTRDWLQMHRGGRFLNPLERTSRGMNDSRMGVLPPP